MAEILTGSTRAVGLVSVLQLAESEALSGLLEIGGARVWLAGGHVVAARFGGAEGIDALLEVMLHRGEDFHVHDEPVERAPPLGDTAPLLLEGCRLMDEWARVDQLVLRARRPLEGALAPLEPWLDGTRTVAAAVERAGLLRVAVAEALAQAVTEGRLERLEQPLPPPLPEDFDELVDLGRRHARAGRLAEARASFERAVSLRPEDRVATQNLRRIVALQTS